MVRNFHDSDVDEEESDPKEAEEAQPKTSPLKSIFQVVRPAVESFSTPEPAKFSTMTKKIQKRCRCGNHNVYRRDGKFTVEQIKYVNKYACSHCILYKTFQKKFEIRKFKTQEKINAARKSEAQAVEKHRTALRKLDSLEDQSGRMWHLKRHLVELKAEINKKDEKEKERLAK